MVSVFGNVVSAAEWGWFVRKVGMGEVEGEGEKERKREGTKERKKERENARVGRVGWGMYAWGDFTE